jgi:hypothetical protein
MDPIEGLYGLAIRESPVIARGAATEIEPGMVIETGRGIGTGRDAGGIVPTTVETDIEIKRGRGTGRGIVVLDATEIGAIAVKGTVAGTETSPGTGPGGIETTARAETGIGVGIGRGRGRREGTRSAIGNGSGIGGDEWPSCSGSWQNIDRYAAKVAQC